MPHASSFNTTERRVEATSLLIHLLLVSVRGGWCVCQCICSLPLPTTATLCPFIFTPFTDVPLICPICTFANPPLPMPLCIWPLTYGHAYAYAPICRSSLTDAPWSMHVTYAHAHADAPLQISNHAFPICMYTHTYKCIYRERAVQRGPKCF